MKWYVLFLQHYVHYKYIIIIITHMQSYHILCQPQVNFESRLAKHDLLNDCTMAVDGKDFSI